MTKNKPLKHSPPNSLSVVDLQKIVAGAGVMLTGAVGAVLIDILLKMAAETNLSTYGGIVVAGVLAIAVNVIRKYRADNTGTP